MGSRSPLPSQYSPAMPTPHLASSTTSDHILPTQHSPYMPDSSQFFEHSGDDSTSSLLVEKQAMPKHWRNDDTQVPAFLRPLINHIFAFLCLVATGRPNLELAWRSMKSSDERDFQAERDRISTMLTNINIVVSPRRFWFQLARSNLIGRLTSCDYCNAAHHRPAQGRHH